MYIASCKFALFLLSIRKHRALHTPTKCNSGRDRINSVPICTNCLVKDGEKVAENMITGTIFAVITGSV